MTKIPRVLLVLALLFPATMSSAQDKYSSFVGQYVAAYQIAQACDGITVYDQQSAGAIAKQSEGKATLPGLHQVFRVSRDGAASTDVIGTLEEFHVDAEALLVQWMEGGELVRKLPSLAEIRSTARAQLGALPEPVRDLAPCEPGDATYPVTLSNALETLVDEVRRRETDREEA